MDYAAVRSMKELAAQQSPEAPLHIKLTKPSRDRQIVRINLIGFERAKAVAVRMIYDFCRNKDVERWQPRNACYVWWLRPATPNRMAKYRVD